MEETPDIEQKIAEIEAELSTLDHRRSQLLDELTQLRQQPLQEKLLNSTFTSSSRRFCQ